MSEATAPRFTGWHMLALMLGFFGIIIGVNVYLSVVAIRSWTGLVVEASNASGRDYNEKVKRTEEQAALGWSGEVRYEAGSIRFSLLDRDGAPLKVPGVTAEITRPLGDREDKTIPLAPLADGSFAAAVALTPGIWNVVATAAETPHGAYERRDQIVVP